MRPRRVAVVSHDRALVQLVGQTLVERFVLMRFDTLAALALLDPTVDVAVVDATTVPCTPEDCAWLDVPRAPALYIVQVPDGSPVAAGVPGARRITLSDSGPLALRAALRAIVTDHPPWDDESDEAS